MFLARVIGSVVATRKESSMQGKKLLLLKPVLPDPGNPKTFKEGTNTIVAADAIGAGEGDMVLFCSGSSARQATGMKTLPVDAVIIGLVDTVTVSGTLAFSSKD